LEQGFLVIASVSSCDGKYGCKGHGSGLLKELNIFKSSFWKLPKEEMAKNISLSPN
jgi:hypothetical protein